MIAACSSAVIFVHLVVRQILRCPLSESRHSLSMSTSPSWHTHAHLDNSNPTASHTVADSLRNATTTSSELFLISEMAKGEISTRSSSVKDQYPYNPSIRETHLLHFPKEGDSSVPRPV